MVHQGTQGPVGFIMPNRAAAVVVVEQSSPRRPLIRVFDRSARFFTDLCQRSIIPRQSALGE